MKVHRPLFYSKLLVETNFTVKWHRQDFSHVLSGKKIVIRGGLDGIKCDKYRYQPIPFLTNVSHQCLFQKSLCTEEGQVVANDSKTNTDVSCRCDYTKGYVFLYRPAHPCFCIPSEEDCSCYLKKCNYNENLSSG